MEMDLQKEEILNFSIKDIKEGSKIAFGGFGDIYKGYFLTTQVAIKKLKEFTSAEFLKEIRITKKYKHPYSPRLLGQCDNSTSSKDINASIINELIQGLTINDLILKKTLSEIENMVIMIDLSTVLNYLHAFRVVHRDLKPQNIMLTNEGELKLLDFGISRVTNATFTTTRSTGTLAYMAPETFNIEV